MTSVLPPPVAGTTLRVLATSDLGAATVPMRTSHGDSGTCAGVVALLERERERQPTVWLDVGDLVVGHPSYPLLGERPWADVADLPIGAAAVGNHDFDDGVDALLAADRALSFPLLCANVDVGLPATAMVGDVGVIGLDAPARRPPVVRAGARRGLAGARARFGARAARRRSALGGRAAARGRHVVADRQRRSTGRNSIRPPRGDRTAVGAARRPDPRRAQLRGVDGPARGDARGRAASLRVLGGRRRPRGRRARARRRSRSRGAPGAVEPGDRRARGARRAHSGRAARAVARPPRGRALPAGLHGRRLPCRHRRRRGARHAELHGVQAPLDGAIAALGPGTVTELDLLRLVAAPGYDPVVVELRPGELDRARDAHWATADPRNAATDALPWNWCRMPLGVSGNAHRGGSVAVIPAVANHLSEWLDRDLDAQPADVTARQALAAAIR